MQKLAEMAMLEMGTSIIGSMREVIKAADANKVMGVKVAIESTLNVDEVT